MSQTFRILLFMFVWLACSDAKVSAQTNSQQVYFQCLTNFETYGETIWHSVSGGAYPTNAGYWGDGGNSGNGAIRGNCGVAVAYAVLVNAQPGNPANATRIAHITQALNYAAQSHVTGSKQTVNNGKWGWSSGTLATCTSQGGVDWQSAEWAGSLGLACILVQSNLPAQTIADVQAVIASEATHRAGISPCTRILSDGDTKAEENGWDGNILALAAAWMTNNANAANWLSAAKSYLVNTYTVAQSDLITPNTTGDPLAAWVSTVTIFPSYALENHGFYHPTYEMVAGMSLGDSLLMAKLANPNIATQLQPYAEHNVMAVWTNNLDNLLMDSGDFAYPAGVDWSVHDFEQNSFITWMAAHFNDPLARWADDKLSQCVRYHQIVNGDGTFVGTSAGVGGGILFYREAVEARRTAIAWLHLATADHPTGTMTAPGASLMTNSDVQVIEQRSAFGTFSVSYNGSRIMALVEPAALAVPTNAFISSPRLPGILGLGALGNPTSATLVSLATNVNGFDAELKISSSLGTTEEYIKGTGESFAIIEVPRLNSGSTAASGGSFICGIENDPLSGGTRLLEWAGGSASLAAFSGVTRNVTNNWVCVAGRYGLAAGPAGYFHYVANTSYTRTSPSYSEAGEAEDALSFVENNQLAPRYAVWFPAKSTLQTSNSAAAITWGTNSLTSTVTLTFPGVGGAATTLSAFVGVSSTNNNGAWNVDANGNWGDAGNWSGGLIGDGTGFTADFSTVNKSADRTVTLDSSRNIGTLKFGDAGGAQNWTLTNSGGSVLTLNNNSSSPLIAVANTATTAAPLAGTSGFTKSGTGTLVLSGSNSLSGTLYVDSASTTASDGAVRIAQGASVANVASPIYLRNNNNGSSMLQLDGSAANVTVAQDISLAGRNAAVISIQNLSGSNTLAGNFILASGGGLYWFDSEAGTLTLSGLIPASAPSVPNARTLTFMGPGGFVVSGSISNANGFAVSLVKSNAGALTLNGVNTYTGSTTISGGTLSGRGTIAGPVTIAAGATLSPGNGTIGTLTINNALTNNGAFVIRLNKSGGGLTNDNVKGVSTLVFGGPLQLVSAGDPITAGDSFKLFAATNYKGFITGLTPATPGTNLLWNTSNLAVNGTLAVALGTVQPRVGGVALAGTNLVFSGGGGAAGYGFSILAATNLTMPFTNWPVIGTGVCDSNGNFMVTNGLNPTNLWQFYVIRMP
ncbi:MAG: autotransporter-associated beta strand repeat-containing protein [Verrucomicrobiae bacterium]|nr:autotransporter-associated beta strand repeat-containing protein [Verrucomicrobiae bacterium]